VILRNELTRQPASQCRSSTLTIFIGNLLDSAIHFIREPPTIPGRYLIRVGKQHQRQWPPRRRFGAVSEFFTWSTTAKPSVPADILRPRHRHNWQGVGILYTVSGNIMILTH
jgi:hypothetical protein